MTNPRTPGSPRLPDASASAALRERLRAAAELLEQVAADRGLLTHLDEPDRQRLIRAAGDVFSPDPAARRRLVKSFGRQRRNERKDGEEKRLAETGIRSLRRQPVFTTPRAYAPLDFVPLDVPPDADGLEGDAGARADLGTSARFESSAPGHGDDTRGPGAARLSDAPGKTDAAPEAPPGKTAPRRPGSARSPDGPRRPDAAPEALPGLDPRDCYVCKQTYTTLHHFYDQLCPACAELNWAKRSELADLGGRVALLTGGRVKIGYQTGIKLLRCGVQLIVTTRFPRDAAARYAREPDFALWGDRLQIFGLDLRHTPSVEGFCHVLGEQYGRLDFIVNNACQTVRRPPEFYAHMMADEAAALPDMPAHVRKLVGAYEGVRGYHLLPEGEGTALARREGGAPALAGLTHAAELSQVPLLPEEMLAQRDLFPTGRLDQDLQQVDLRGRNSWRLLLAEVPTVELLEVQLVNAIAPFVLNARLKPLMLASPERDKHVVNVSAVEGQFYRSFKTTRHPHTNMAKAALNMMTRTAAADYHNDGIHMNSVDTGWVTDEDPAEIAARKVAEHRFHPPLDIVDGAARILDPIIAGFNTGQHAWGQFLKNYQSTPW